MKKQSTNLNWIWIASAVPLAALLWFLYVENTDINQTGEININSPAIKDVAADSRNLRTDEHSSASLTDALALAPDFKQNISTQERERIAMELQQLRKPFAEIEKSNAVILSDFTSDKYRKISLKVSEPTQKQIEAAYSEISKHLSNFDTTKAPYSIFKKDALSLLNEYFYFWKPIKIIRLVIPRDSSEPTRLHELFANNITDLNFDDKGGLSYMTGGGKGTVEFNIVSDFGIKGAKSTERYAQFLNYAKFD